MKKFIIISISTILILLLIFSGYFIYENSYNKQVHVESKMIHNQEFEKLSVSLPADVSIKRGNKFQVKYYSTDSSNFYISKTGNEIYVGKHKEKDHFLSEFFKGLTIGNNHLDKAEITIPKNVKNINDNSKGFKISNVMELGLLNISSKNADVNVDNIKLAQLLLSNENGDINLDNLITKKVNVDNSNGDIDISNANILSKKSIISNENGDITIINTSSEFNDTFVNTDNGDITLKNTKNIRKND